MPPMSPSSGAARGVVPAHRPWHWLYQYCRKANIGSTLTCLGPSWEHAEGCGAAAGLISTFLVPAGLPVGLSPSPTAQQLLSAPAQRSWLCSAGDAQAQEDEREGLGAARAAHGGGTEPLARRMQRSGMSALTPARKRSRNNSSRVPRLSRLVCSWKPPRFLIRHQLFPTHLAAFKELSAFFSPTIRQVPRRCLAAFCWPAPATSNRPAFLRAGIQPRWSPRPFSDLKSFFTEVCRVAVCPRQPRTPAQELDTTRDSFRAHRTNTRCSGAVPQAAPAAALHARALCSFQAEQRRGGDACTLQITAVSLMAAAKLRWVCRAGKSPACRTGLPSTSCSGLGIPKRKPGTRTRGPHLVPNHLHPRPWEASPPPAPLQAGCLGTPQLPGPLIVINRLFCLSPGGKGRQPAGVRSTARSRTALTRLKMLLRGGRDPAPSEG